MKTIQRVFIVVLCVGAALLIQGCPRSNSCNIQTPGLYCNFDVTDNGVEVKASVIFSVGNALGTQLNLGVGCNDSVTVNGLPMQLFQNVAVYYEATIPRADQYEFVFTRGNSKEEFHAVVKTPPSITITAPVEGEPKSRKDPFNVSWDNNYPENAGKVALWITGDCVSFVPQQMVDNGIYTVNAGTVKPRDANNPSASCDATVTLIRQINGTLDTGVQGQITGKSTANIWINSAP